MKTCFFNVFGLGCIMLAVILCGCMSWFHQGKQEMATRSMQEKIQAIVNIVGEYRKLTKEHVLQSSKVLLHTKIPQGGQRVDEIITIKNESGGETKLHYLFGTTLRDVSVYDIDKKHIYDIYLDDKDTHFTYMEYTKEYDGAIYDFPNDGKLKSYTVVVNGMVIEIREWDQAGKCIKSEKLKEPYPLISVTRPSKAKQNPKP